MLFALREDLLDHVNASQTTLEILTLLADQNVQQTVNAPQRKHVKICTVLILVLKQTVATMPNVKLSITFQTVYISFTVYVTKRMYTIIAEGNISHI